MKIRRFRQQAGQTIIEILIATLVVGLVMTAIAATLTLAIRNTAEAKFRSYASLYAHQAMEIFIRERNLQGWQQFQESLVTGTYCLNDLPLDTDAFRELDASECQTGLPFSGTDFYREANVTVVSDDQVQVEIVVSWQDSGRDRSVTVAQEFRRY